MSQPEFKIKYKTANGDEITSNHGDVEIYKEHRRKIADQGGVILEESGPLNEGKVQLLSE